MKYGSSDSLELQLCVLIIMDVNVSPSSHFMSVDTRKIEINMFHMWVDFLGLDGLLKSLKQRGDVFD